MIICGLKLIESGYIWDKIDWNRLEAISSDWLLNNTSCDKLKAKRSYLK